jgi:hypothetical protein
MNDEILDLLTASRVAETLRSTCELMSNLVDLALASASERVTSGESVILGFPWIVIQIIED